MYATLRTVIAKLFRRQEPPVIEKKPWPSALNPCLFGGYEAQHHQSCGWDVQGKVTNACGQCVAYFEKKLVEHDVENPRITALYWFFKPDETANDCLYGGGYERPNVHPRPDWADELLPPK